MHIILNSLLCSFVGYIGVQIFVWKWGKEYFDWHLWEIPFFIISGIFFAWLSGVFWLTGISMVIIHITWTNDILYYCWACAFNVKGFENRTTTKLWIILGFTPHSKWTIAGRLGYISLKANFIQSALGILVVTLLYLIF